MKKITRCFGAIFYILFFSGLAFADIDSKAGQFEEVSLASASDGTESKAAYFKADQGHAVICVPGMRYRMESWYFLVEHFRSKGISTLALDGQDILKAITFLTKRGYKKISLIGASMGGEAILSAVNENKLDMIAKIAVIAPYGGKPVKKSIKKLFVVSKRDMYDLHEDTVKLYNNSSEPKKLKVYTTTAAHGIELFSSKKVKDDLIAMIVEFFKNGT